MKKRIKKITIVIAIVTILIGINVGCIFGINNLLFQHTEGLVYRTKTGNCYHSPGCGYLWTSSIPIGIEQAKKSSLQICSRCGSIPKGTIIVNNYGASFAIAISIEIGILSFFYHKYMVLETYWWSVGNANRISG